MGTRGSFSEG